MLIFNEYGSIVGAFILIPQEDDGNMNHDKIPGKLGKTVNLKNIEIPIHPIYKPD